MAMCFFWCFSFTSFLPHIQQSKHKPSSPSLLFPKSPYHSAYSGRRQWLKWRTLLISARLFLVHRLALQLSLFMSPPGTYVSMAPFGQPHLQGSLMIRNPQESHRDTATDMDVNMNDVDDKSTLMVSRRSPTDGDKVSTCIASATSEMLTWI